MNDDDLSFFKYQIAEEIENKSKYMDMEYQRGDLFASMYRAIGKSVHLTISANRSGLSKITGHRSTHKLKELMSRNFEYGINSLEHFKAHTEIQTTIDMPTLSVLRRELEDIDQIHVDIPVQSMFPSGQMVVANYESGFRIYSNRDGETNTSFMEYLEENGVPLVSFPRFGGMVRTGSQQDIIMELSGFGKVYESTNMLGSQFHSLIPKVVLQAAGEGICVIPSKLEW